MDHSPPVSSVHGILQARILEWGAISFSRGTFLTQGSKPGLLHCRQILYHLNHQRMVGFVFRSRPMSVCLSPPSICLSLHSFSPPSLLDEFYVYFLLGLLLSHLPLGPSQQPDPSSHLLSLPWPRLSPVRVTRSHLCQRPLLPPGISPPSLDCFLSASLCPSL